MNDRFHYKSVLSGYIRQFVEMKEAAGFKIERARWILKEFDDYAESVGLDKPGITRELVEGWRKTRIYDSPRTIYAKYVVWHQLATHMNHQGVRCFVTRLPRLVDMGFSPYIFSKEQLASIFLETDRSRVADANKSVGLFAMPALLRFLYSTGVRISEALSLKNGDVRLDEQYALIRNTKNDVDRIVPICESLETVLRQYEIYRDKMPIPDISAPCGLFFIRPDGTGLNNRMVLDWFRNTYSRCGIAYLGDHKGPRLHDLRHTYACHALERMSRSGMDVYAGLPVLSCALGHRSTDATEQYVRLTRAMYGEMAEQCSELSSFVLQGLKIGEGES